MIRPCLDCHERTADCHSTCGAYKIYKGVTTYRNSKMQRMRTKDYEAATIVIDSMMRHKIKGF